jgi:hypothetical protein
MKKTGSDQCPKTHPLIPALNQLIAFRALVRYSKFDFNINLPFTPPSRKCLSRIFMKKSITDPRTNILPIRVVRS